MDFHGSNVVDFIPTEITQQFNYRIKIFGNDTELTEIIKYNYILKITPTKYSVFWKNVKDQTIEERENSVKKKDINLTTNDIHHQLMYLGNKIAFEFLN